jgi:ribosomal protein L24
MRGALSVRKPIWVGDRVKVISGVHIGKEGIVTKREPAKSKYVHFVYVRFDSSRGGSIGPKIHVRNVQVTEMSKFHVDALLRKKAANRSKSKTSE